MEKKIALYLRLSMADGDLGKDNKDESNSIENQRLLLLDYLNYREDLQGDTLEYVDDGYSGTNFDRPSFRTLIEDCKKGLVSTIMVKDLSRLGREYIGVGDYVEQIFPVLGVRFIAVNNHFDSLDFEGNAINLDLAVSNLINSFYSRDLSKKIRTCFETKWRQGRATSSNVPFGYVWDMEKKEWMIDPVAAGYVRHIFDLALKGYGTSRIASELNEEKIPLPSAVAKGRTKEKVLKVIAPEEEHVWLPATVWRILRRYEYTGALVMGKYQRLAVGKKTRRQLPEEDWIITENAHEAIVSHEEYWEAQSVIRKISGKGFAQERKYPLKGKVRCGTCRRCMEYEMRSSGGIYICGYKRSSGKHSGCYGGSYEEAMVNARVGYAIRRMLGIAKHLSATLEEKRVKDAVAMEFPNVEELEKEIKKLKSERMRSYESYAAGVIRKDKYLAHRDEITRKIKEYEQKIEQTETMLQEEQAAEEGLKEITGQAEATEMTGPLTKEMVDAFVKDVYLYDESHIEVVFHGEDAIRAALDQCFPEEKGERKVCGC